MLTIPSLLTVATITPNWEATTGSDDLLGTGSDKAYSPYSVFAYRNFCTSVNSANILKPWEFSENKSCTNFLKQEKQIEICLKSIQAENCIFTMLNPLAIENVNKRTEKDSLNGERVMGHRKDKSTTDWLRKKCNCLSVNRTLKSGVERVAAIQAFEATLVLSFSVTMALPLSSLSLTVTAQQQNYCKNTQTVTRAIVTQSVTHSHTSTSIQRSI